MTSLRVTDLARAHRVTTEDAKHYRQHRRVAEKQQTSDQGGEGASRTGILLCHADGHVIEVIIGLQERSAGIDACGRQALNINFVTSVNTETGSSRL